MADPLIATFWCIVGLKRDKNWRNLSLFQSGKTSETIDYPFLMNFGIEKGPKLQQFVPFSIPPCIRKGKWINNKACQKAAILWVQSDCAWKYYVCTLCTKLRARRSALFNPLVMHQLATVYLVTIMWAILCHTDASYTHCNHLKNILLHFAH